MNNDKQQDLATRTKAFALRIIRLYASLPKTAIAQIIGKQALRSGTSVGAHYREARRGKSDADFVNKIEGGLQELDETANWLELLGKSGVVKPILLKPLLDETEELTAIFVTMAKKVKNKMKPARHNG